MAEYIDLTAELRLFETVCRHSEKPDIADLVRCAWQAIEELAKNSPKLGKWTLNKDGSGTCSVCGRKQYNCWDLDNWDNFCHFCGADMRQRLKEGE